MLNDVEFVFKYKPFEKQKLFHNSQAKFRVYAGGMGSGKTLAGVAEAWQLSMEYPNNYGLVGRMTYPELRDTTWKELIEFPVIEDEVEMRIIDSSIVRRYDKNKMEIELFNGSIIIGRALEDSFDKLAKGLNLGWVYIDELTETPKKMWDGISRLRLRRKVNCPKCKILPTGGGVICPECQTVTIRHTAFGTTNPEGHDWVWQDFIMNADENHFLVSASSLENPYLPDEYIKELESMPDDWKKRYLYGSFDTFEGLVYKEFQDKEPYVIKEFNIPEHWQRYVMMDWGYRNPSCILWGAVNEVGVLHIYDEFYASGMVVSQLATIIKTKSQGQKILMYLIDPSCRNRDGKTGRSNIDEFSDNGVYFSPANNAWEAGVNHVQEFIKLKDGKPHLKIFDKCINLRTELQTYRYSDMKPSAVKDAPERPLKKNDHAVDALRYGVCYLCEVPRKVERKSNWRDWLKNTKDYKIQKVEEPVSWMAQ